MKITALELSQAGFREDTILEIIEKQRPALKKAGFSDVEINEAYNIQPTSSSLLTDDIVDEDPQKYTPPTTDPYENNIKQELQQKDPENINQEAINNEYEFNGEKFKNWRELDNDTRTAMEKEFADVLQELKTENEMPENKEVELMATALKEDKPDIEFHKKTLRSGIQKRREENQQRLLNKKQRELEEGIKPFEMLNPYLTTGKNSRRMKDIYKDYYKFQPYQMQNIENFLSMMAVLESDNRNIHSSNPNSTAAGLWQFTEGTTVTAINNYFYTRKDYDRSYVNEKWAEEALEHKDMTNLEPDQQKALLLAHMFQQEGSDELIRNIANGDVGSMKEYYLKFHHTQPNEKLKERVDYVFSYWNNRAGPTKYVNPKMATFPVDTSKFGKTDIGKAITKPLAYAMGGMGNKNAFTTGYEQSVHGMLQKYVNFVYDNPDMTKQERTDYFKDMIMYNENQAFGDELVKSVSQMINDLPYMIGGGVAFPAFLNTISGGVAAPLTPMTSMVGAFMLPEMLRYPLVEGMLDQKHNNFEEYIKNFVSIENGKIALKMGAIGAATSFGGHLVKNIASRKLGFGKKSTTTARLLAETGIMTELGFALNGEVPTFKDFAHTAILLFGFHATQTQVTNLINIYKKYGRHPFDVKNEAEQSGTYKETLRKSEIPEFYETAQEMAGRKAENVTNKKLLPVAEFQINEIVNTTVSGRDKAMILNKEIINDDSVFIVQDNRGNTFSVLESQVRKMDPQKNMEAEIVDGKINIKDKKIPEDAEAQGVTGIKGSFTKRQEKGEFNKELQPIEITNDKSVVIKGETPKTNIQNIQNLKKQDKGQFRYVISNDKKIVTDGAMIATTKYYPELTKKIQTYKKLNNNKQATLNRIAKQNSKDIYEKAFPKEFRKQGFDKLVPILVKKQELSNDLVLRNKATKEYIQIDKTRFDILQTFKNAEGKIQKAEIGYSNNRVVFINPNNKEIIGVLADKKIDKTSKEYNQYNKYYEEYSENFNQGTSYYSKSTRDSNHAGIPNEPYTPRDFTTRNRDTWKEIYDSGTSLNSYDLITLTQALLGAAPKLKKMKKGYLGMFRHLKDQDLTKPLSKQAEVIVNREIQNNPEEFLKTLAHEIGHLIDFVPTRSMAKGNILGRFKGMRTYMKDWIDGKNDGAKPMSVAEKKEMMKEAERIAEENKGQTNAEIKELNVTPETILDIVRDPNIRNKIDPELYKTFAQLSDVAKKEVMKDAMKGLTSPHLKEIVDKINNKDVTKSLSPEAAEVFKEMFEAEMIKRNIVRKEEIVAELKELTMKWHPYDRTTAKPDYIKYRDSAPELMAEFQMAFLLRPQWTKLNAPKTYELWSYYMKNRLEVKDLWESIQNELNNPPNIREAKLASEIKEMYRGGEKKTRENIKEIGKQDKQREYDDLGTEMIDTFWWLQTRLKMDNQRGNSPLAKDLKFSIENYRYRHAEVSLYKRQMYEKILHPLESIGYNKHDLGLMLLYKNLAHSKQREGKITWKLYKIEPQLLQKLKNETDFVGLYENYAQAHPQLSQIADKFFELRQTEVVQRLQESTMLNAQQKAELAENVFYITYRPIEKLIQRHVKSGISSWGSKYMKKTQGTFEEIMNPLDMTILNDMQLLSEIKRQELYSLTIKFLNENKKSIETYGKNVKQPINVINKPKMIGKGKIDPNIPTGLKRVTFMENGEIKTFDIPKTIAEAMEGNPVATWRSLKYASKVNSLFRGIFTEHNPLFWVVNWGFRDVRRSMITLPNGKTFKSPLTRGQYIKEVYKSLKPALKSVYGTGTELTRHMEKNGFFIGLEEGYRGDAGMARSRLEMDEDSFALKRFIDEQYIQKGKFGKLYDGTMGKYLMHSGNVARALERSHKIAGYKVLKDQVAKGELDLTDKEMMYIVQTQIGSPSFLRTGKANPVLNTAFLFYNANKEGYRGDYEAFKNDPKGVGGRFAAYSAAPEILKFLISMGLLGSGMQAYMNAIPDHDKHNFNIIPTGMLTQDGRPIYIRIPMDFTSQLISSLTNMSLETAFGLQSAKNTGEKIKMFWKGFDSGSPFQVTPIAPAVLDTLNLIFGEDAKNYFGGPLIDEDIMKLDIDDLGYKKLKELMKYNWNTYGPNWIYKFQSNDKAEILKQYEKMTGIPLLDPLINKFVKVGPNPILDTAREYNKLENDRENLMIVARKDALKKILQGKINLTQDELNSLGMMKQDVVENTEFIRQLGQFVGADELLIEYVVGDRKQRINILRSMHKYRTQMPRFYEKWEEARKGLSKLVK